MLLKCNKWRKEFGVDKLKADDPDIEFEMKTGKVCATIYYLSLFTVMSVTL